MAEPKARILVVDDDPELLDMVQRVLTPHGFEVRTHTSALGVASLVRTAQPDVVLIDVNFPAIKGDKVVHLARQQAPQGTKFLLYSAMDELRLRALALASGADGYLLKSVQGAELAQQLKALLRQPRAATPSRS